MKKSPDVLQQMERLTKAELIELIKERSLYIHVKPRDVLWARYLVKNRRAAALWDECCDDSKTARGDLTKHQATWKKEDKALKLWAEAARLADLALGMNHAG